MPKPKIDEWLIRSILADHIEAIDELDARDFRFTFCSLFEQASKAGYNVEDYRPEYIRYCESLKGDIHDKT